MNLSTVNVTVTHLAKSLINLRQLAQSWNSMSFFLFQLPHFPEEYNEAILTTVPLQLKWTERWQINDDLMNLATDRVELAFRHMNRTRIFPKQIIGPNSVFRTFILTRLLHFLTFTWYKEYFCSVTTKYILNFIIQGVTHCEDLSYVFSPTGLPGPMPFIEKLTQGKNIDFSKKFVKMLTSFMETG